MIREGRLLTLAVVSMLLIGFVVPDVLGARSSKPKEIVVVGSKVKEVGPLEGQGPGWTTNLRGDDGGYMVIAIDEPGKDRAVMNMPLVDPASGLTIPRPQILRPLEPSSTPSYAFHLRAQDSGGPSAGVRLYDALHLGTDPEEAVFEAYLDESGRMKVAFPYAGRDLAPRVFGEPLYPVDTYIQVDVDIAEDGTTDVCVFPMHDRLERHNVKALSLSLPRLPTGAPPVVDTLAFYHAATPDLPAVEARWGTVFGPEPGQALDPRPCPFFFDDFSAHEVGSDLGVHPDWTYDGEGPGPFMILEEILADGRVNRYASVTPDKPEKIKAGPIKWQGATGGLSLSANLRSNGAPAQFDGLTIRQFPEVSGYKIFLGDLGKVMLGLPDGRNHTLAGGWEPDEWRDVGLVVTEREDHAVVVACHAPGSPFMGDFSMYQQTKTTGWWRDSVTVTLVADDGHMPGALFVESREESGAGKMDFNDFLYFGSPVDTCRVAWDDFEDYKEGSDLRDQGGWQVLEASSFDGRYMIMHAPHQGHVVENTAPAAPIIRKDARHDTYSVGVSMSTSDPLQRSTAFYVADSSSGVAPEQGNLVIQLEDAIIVAYGHAEPDRPIIIGAVPNTPDEFFDVFVDVGPRGLSEICVRAPIHPGGLNVYTHTLGPRAEGAADTLGLWAGDDPDRTAVIRWSDVMMGGGDGDLCPEPPRVTLEPSGTAGSQGWWRSDVTVALSCVDPETGAAFATTPRYSLNGGDLLEAQLPEWWIPVTAEGTNHLETYCERRTDYWWAEEMVLQIDTVPPMTTATGDGVPGNNGWYVSPVTVTLACEDETSGCRNTWFRVDGGRAQQYVGGFVLGDEDGVYTLEYWSADVAGNVETANVLMVMVDQTPPRVEVERPVQGCAYTLDQDLPCPLPLPQTVVAGDLTVVASASDVTSGVARVELLVDGIQRGAAHEAPYEIPWQVQVADLGEREVELRAFDVAGNRESVHVVVFVVPVTP